MLTMIRMYILNTGQTGAVCYPQYRYAGYLPRNGRGRLEAGA